MGRKTNGELKEEAKLLKEEKAYEPIFNKLDEIVSDHKDLVNRIRERKMTEDFFKEMISELTRSLNELSKKASKISAIMPAKKNFKKKVLDEIKRLTSRYEVQSKMLSKLNLKSSNADLKFVQEQVELIQTVCLEIKGVVSVEEFEKIIELANNIINQMNLAIKKRECTEKLFEDWSERGIL